MKKVPQILVCIFFISVILTTIALADSPVILNREAVKLGDQKKYDQALKKLNLSKKLFNKASAKVFYNRALVLESQKKFDQAIANYQIVIKRDPEHAKAYGRLGFRYYKKQKFTEAVEFGEKSLAIEPANREVIAWLMKAYAEKLAAAKKPKPEIKLAAKKDAKDKKKTLKDVAEETKKHKMLYAAIDFSIKTGYEFDTDNKYQYYSSEGKVINIPTELHFWFKPAPVFKFKIDTGYPYLGASMPNIVNQYEKFEGIFDLGIFVFGAGCLITHYKEDVVTGSEEKIYDIKPGIILGLKNKKSDFLIECYPRYPYDDEDDSGLTFDAAITNVKYVYTLDKNLSYFSRLSFVDYYFIDHDTEISNYWGYYEILIGATLQKSNVAKMKGISVSFEIGKRVNLEKLNDPDAYKKGNGQGYLGYDRDPDDDLDEKTFSGYQSISNILNFHIVEYINENFFLYQKFKIEYVDRHEEHHDLTVQLGAGVTL